MHELSIDSAIVGIVERHASGRRVTKVQVKVGHLRQVENVGNLDAVNPGVERMLMSARTGQGVDEWGSWLEQRKPA